MATGDRTKEPLTHDQEGVLLRAAETEFDRRTLLVLLETGMHISVLSKESKGRCGLAVKDGFISWKRPKTKRTVKFPVPPRLAPFVEEFIATLPVRGRQWWWRKVKRLSERAATLPMADGLPDGTLRLVSPLTFRHTFAVRRFEAGWTVPEVQAVMRVTNVSTLLRYAEHTGKMVEATIKVKGWGS